MKICLYAKYYTVKEAEVLMKKYKDLARETKYTGDDKWATSLEETAIYLEEQIKIVENM